MQYAVVRSSFTQAMMDSRPGSMRVIMDGLKPGYEAGITGAVRKSPLNGREG